MTTPWDQMQCYYWLIYRLRIWLWNSFSILVSISGNMWTRISKYSHWQYNCDYVMCIAPMYVESTSRQVPGCVGRIRVAPIQGEQPDPSTSRCGYCWLKGSMMRIGCTETLTVVLLLPPRYFKLKVLFIMIDTTRAYSWINPNSVRTRNNHKFWSYAIISQDRRYLVFVLH